MNPVVGQLLLQAVLIALNAVFACSEIAVISMNENKIAKLSEGGDKRASRISKLMKQPARFLATIQVGITLGGFLAASFASQGFKDGLASWFISLGIGSEASRATLETVASVITTLILSYFMLVLGELVPKRLAMRNSDKLALAFSGLAAFISKAFAPFVWLLTVSTNGILRLLGIDPHQPDDVANEEEIRLMVEAASANGGIKNDAREMIQNIFEFDDKSAADIMTHRVDACILWLEELETEWERTIMENRFTYYPVCGESVDDVVGVLSTKDYFRLKEKTRESILSETVKTAFFVPETVHTDILFFNMKSNRTSFAVVMDEYGGFSGIVTMNDLLEQLVGTLEDENAPVEPEAIEKTGQNEWRIRGDAELDDLTEQLGIVFDIDDVETFSGLVFDVLGYIPEGQTPELTYKNLNIKVEAIKSHNVESAIVTLIEENSEKDRVEEHSGNGDH